MASHVPAIAACALARSCSKSTAVECTPTAKHPSLQFSCSRSTRGNVRTQSMREHVRKSTAPACRAGWRQRIEPVVDAGNPNACASTGFGAARTPLDATRSEEHTSELQSSVHLVCRLLLEKKKQIK